jgi:IPT/TIG domain
MKRSSISPNSLAAIAATLAAGLLFAFLTGCNEEPPASLYDETAPTGAQPVISTVTPPAPGLAGVTELTITGQNFSSVKTQNTVYFGAQNQVGTVLAASTTQLRVLPPPVIGDTVAIRIAVTGAQLFSNTVNYSFVAAATEFGSLESFEEPWAMATDGAGNVYLSMISSGVGVGIKKFTPDGVRSDFAPAGGVTKYSGLKVGPGGDLFGVRSARAIYRIPAAGGTPVVWAQITGSTLYDLDFDEAGNIWTAGSVTRLIYRMKVADKSTKSFAHNGDVRSIRYYSGYLYVGGKTYPDSLERVMRYQVISADSLGPAEEYFNLSSSVYAGRFVYAINFASDGSLFIGTDAVTPILLVNPDKTSQPYYPGLFGPTMHQLVWGGGTTWYTVKGTASGGSVSASKTVYKVNMQKTGAPYYGRP